MLVWVPSVIAVVIAVLVPWFTFRLALRQDRIRRLHDQRADLYIELLTEAYAEKDYFEYEIEDDETRERMRSYRRDLRLQPLERARLGARGTMFASREVNRLFTTLQAQALAATLAGRPKDEAERLAARLQVGQAFDGLEAQVRREMGTDEIRA
jgi:phosphoglycolate phosphatase-like HAD superfamily hydrolase